MIRIRITDRFFNIHLAVNVGEQVRTEWKTSVSFETTRESDRSRARVVEMEMERESDIHVHR
jgi:hypothetical protein